MAQLRTTKSKAFFRAGVSGAFDQYLQDIQKLPLIKDPREERRLARLADAMLDAMRRDKKARAGEIHFTLLRRVGEIAKTDDGNWTHPVPGATIRAALNQSF